MCLDLKRNAIKLRAEEDIICYKVLIFEDTPKGRIFKTPFQKKKVKIGKSYTSWLWKKFSKDEVHFGIHSMATFRGARCLNISDYTDTVIVRCCIPKGSNYYVGYFCCDPSYASNALVYTCQVDKNNMPI